MSFVHGTVLLHQLNPARFSISCNEELHAFHPITSYLCTLSHTSIENFEREGNQITEGGILQPNLEAIDLATAQHLTLKASSLSHIESLLENMRTTQLKKTLKMGSVMITRTPVITG